MLLEFSCVVVRKYYRLRTQQITWEESCKSLQQEIAVLLTATGRYVQVNAHATTTTQANNKYHISNVVQPNSYDLSIQSINQIQPQPVAPISVTTAFSLL